MEIKINSCVATTTILMGVVGFYVNYDLDGINFVEIFVFDYDMRELSNHQIVREPIKDDIKNMIDEAFGGLGGESKQIDFGSQFLRFFYNECRRTKSETYKVASKKSPLLSAKKSRNYVGIVSYEILFPSHNLSEYELIHYFMMRLFANHEDIVECLSENYYPDAKMNFTIMQNVLKPVSENETKHIYEYSSLVFEEDYFLVTGEITVSGSLVSDFFIKDITPLTPFQVAQTLKKDEIISLFSIEKRNFEEVLAFENRRLSVHLYPTGRLYMSYRQDNKHVDSEVFTLSDDVVAKIFITDSFQLLLSTKNQKDADFWQKKLVSRYGNSLVKQGEWLFSEEVLLDFIDSGMSDFNEWLI